MIAIICIYLNAYMFNFIISKSYFLLHRRYCNLNNSSCVRYSKYREITLDSIKVSHTSSEFSEVQRRVETVSGVDGQSCFCESDHLFFVPTSSDVFL